MTVRISVIEQSFKYVIFDIVFDEKLTVTCACNDLDTVQKVTIVQDDDFRTCVNFLQHTCNLSLSDDYTISTGYGEEHTSSHIIGTFSYTIDPTILRDLIRQLISLFSA